MRILAFPYHDWRKGQREGMRWRDGHILETLDSHPSVDGILVVDRPVSLAEQIGRRASATVRGDVVDSRREGMTRGRITRVSPKTSVLDLSVRDLISPLAKRHAWWFDVFERVDVLDLIAWASDLMLDPKPMAIAWMPTVAGPIRRVDPSRLLFDSLDNWLLHPQLRRHAVRATRGYAELLGRADAVIASAPRSQAVLATFAQRVDIIPNGVSVDVFSRESSRPKDLPEGPIVGYAGSLGPRVDTDLVVEVAKQLPWVKFVFIGQSLDRTTARRLARARNVHLLGDRHYSLVPAYIRAFDIAWIPHSIGAGESGGDPIKMYEYWAAGRQVVSTRIDGMARWEGSLHLVSSSAEASSVIDGLLHRREQTKPATVPPERTWESIADTFLDLLAGTAR